MSDASSGDQAPPEIVSTSLERPASHDDKDAVVRSSPPNDETSPPQLKGHAEDANLRLHVHIHTVSVQKEVRTHATPHHSSSLLQHSIGPQFLNSTRKLRTWKEFHGCFTTDAP